MAWDGTVNRLIFCIMNDAEGAVALLECGHQVQLRGRLPSLTATLPCDECSKESRERIVNILEKDDK